MAGRKVIKKTRFCLLDLENLPNPAKHLILMQLRVFDWYQVRQLSKHWMEAVDLEVRVLAEGSRLPRDLASRFVGVETLDLECCEHRVSAKELVHAILNLPRLQALLNVCTLDWVSRLLGQKSAGDRAKRARLSARMTRLSFGELLDPHQCKLPRDLANIAKEWSNLRAIRLPHRLSSTPDMLALLKPLKASLQSFDIQTNCNLATFMRNLELADMGNLRELCVESSDNTVVDLPCKAFSSLTNLRQLELDGCFRISEGGAGYLNRLGELTALKLASLSLDCSQMQRLTRLTKLKCLQIPDCNFDSPIDFRNAMRAFPGLAELNAEGGWSLSHHQAAQGILPSDLTALAISYGGSDLELMQLMNLPELRRLDLSIGRRNPYLLHVVGSCWQLTHLRLLGDPDDPELSLWNEELHFLRNLTNLRYLSLEDNSRITSAGLVHLEPLTRLAFLDISLCAMEILEPPMQWPSRLLHLPLQWLCLDCEVDRSQLPLKLRQAVYRAQPNDSLCTDPSPQRVRRLCLPAGVGAEVEMGTFEPRAKRVDGLYM